MSSTPGHVEEKLLRMESLRPGSLSATVLKVPHHGSESANTREFIDAVNPAFAIISSSTRHHLPKPTVLRRYEQPMRTILRTDVDRAFGNDHIVCFEALDDDGVAMIDCNYQNIISH